MIKRIYILSLIFTFFIATTGLPVFSHYCQMMKKNSLTGCEECDFEIEETLSCCDEEIFIETIKISASESPCCVENFSFKKLEDDISLTASTKVVKNNVVSLTFKPVQITEADQFLTHSK